MKIWDYYIPSAKGEGWGKFIIDSTGYFSCVTDYGNYAFQWTAHGDGDFREFLIGLDDDYLMGKLRANRKDFNLEATLKNMKTSAKEARRKTQRKEIMDPEIWAVDKEYMREVWDAIEAASSEYECTKVIDDHYRAFPDACEIMVYQTPYDLQAFAKRLMPRFRAMVREELKVTPRVCKAVRV